MAGWLRRCTQIGYTCNGETEKREFIEKTGENVNVIRYTFNRNDIKISTLNKIAKEYDAIIDWNISKKVE